MRISPKRWRNETSLYIDISLLLLCCIHIFKLKTRHQIYPTFLNFIFLSIQYNLMILHYGVKKDKDSALVWIPCKLLKNKRLVINSDNIRNQK